MSCFRSYHPGPERAYSRAPLTLAPPCNAYIALVRAYSAQRLTADVDRAVKNLETRIKRLLSVVAGSEREDEASSTSGSPTRKVTASLAETQETSEEVETYSV